MRMANNLSRRDLFKVGAGVSLAGMSGSLFPAAAAADITSTLATFMAEAATRKLPDAVVEKTKHVILDTFAAIISGSELPPGRFAIQFARAYKGEKVSTVIASNVLSGPIEAALANGMLGHADETDDTHPFSQSHPGCSV